MIRSRRLSASLFVVVLATLVFGRAGAQDRLILRAYAPSIAAFPLMSINVSLTDNNGQRIAGLADSDFTLLEDGVELPATSAEEISLGTRQAFVINTNADMRVRNAAGLSRYDQIRAALLEWWRLPEASLLDADDLSLVTQEGILIQHSSSSAELASRLNGFEPIFQDDVDGYALLIETLNLLYDTRAVNSPSFLIFATPILPSNAELPLENIIAQANENGTAIFPIALTSSPDPEQPGMEPLRTLAAGTGGQLIILDPAVGLTSLASQILSFRTVYQLQYHSLIQSPGEHSLQAQAQVGDQTILSEALPFFVNVQPPEVAFIQPPVEIIRGSDDPSLPLTAYLPTEVNLQVLIDFPDGYERGIVHSYLLVNDEPVLEQFAPPYDSFTWDIANLLEPGVYNLQVHVEDELGLQADTVIHRIRLAVNIPPSGIAALGPALGSLLYVFLLLIVGIVSAMVVLAWIRKRREIKPLQNRTPDPGLISNRRSNLLSESLQAPIEAYLLPADTEDRPENRIPLTGAAINLGSDPSMAPYPFSHPSVNGMHANIKRNAAGQYILRDQGSNSGTWVNYKPVDEDGHALVHGDRIHLGRLELRFQLSSPPLPRRIQITKLEEAAFTDPVIREDP